MPRQRDAIRRASSLVGALTVAGGAVAVVLAPANTAFADIAEAFGGSVVSRLWFAVLAIALGIGTVIMRGRGDGRILELAAATCFVTFLIAGVRLVADALQVGPPDLAAAPALLVLLLAALSFLVALLARGRGHTT